MTFFSSNFHVFFVVGPPMWWASCARAHCTLDNPALDGVCGYLTLLSGAESSSKVWTISNNVTCHMKALVYEVYFTHNRMRRKKYAKFATNITTKAVLAPPESLPHSAPRFSHFRHLASSSPPAYLILPRP